LNHRPGNDSGVLGHFFVVELIHVALNNEIEVKLNKPSNDVDRNHKPFQYGDTILTAVGRGISGSAQALSNSVAGILLEQAVQRENARGNTKAELDCQGDRKAGDHSSILDYGTNETKYRNQCKNREHDRVDPEGNRFVLGKWVSLQLRNLYPTGGSHE